MEANRDFHIAHSCDLHMLQQPLGLGQIHAADLIQRLPHRHKFPAGPVVKFYAQGRGAAASPVVGAASAQAQQPTSRVPKTKVVDTRKGGQVNLEKYDERLENIAAGRTQQMSAGKQKFQGRNQRRNNAFQSGKRRAEEQEKMRRLHAEIAKKHPLVVKIPDEINVGELASRMKKTAAEVVKTLMKNGVMASVSDVIDFDTAAIITEELGCKVEKEVIVTIEERLIDVSEDKEEDLQSRAPVVVVMGHVDHGKTSLLDYIRDSHVASGEAGGITQHIGAYQVMVQGKPITFLDTPGHEAFTAMRARGAMITDVAILVVAADDGIMPQTIESINHAKAANIPIIVAINKMDKPEANPERIKQQLTEYELVPEEWGGETIICPISAKTGMGIDDLLDMVVLTAEVQELKANPNRTAHGAVIEARLDKGRGPVATSAGAERHPEAGRRDHRRHGGGPRAGHDRLQGEQGGLRRSLRAGGDHRHGRGCPARATTSTPWPTSAWPGSWWSSASTSRSRSPPAPPGRRSPWRTSLARSSRGRSRI